jgi:hypothetical protein
MNLNTGLSLKLTPASLVRYLARHQRFLATLIILGLLGFTGYQISRIFGVQPDQAYLTEQQAKSKVPSLRINKATLSGLQSLQSAGSTNIPLSIGKQNPFSLGD